MEAITAPTPTCNTTTAAASASVQHVTKKSSDELLRKFADSGDEAEVPARKQLAVRVSKRRKRRSRVNGDGDQQCESPLSGKSGLVERRSLLPAGTKSKALFRKIGIHGGRASHLRARDIRNKSLFGTIHKTWRMAIEGASKVFMEKHYNRHKRLINDIV
ncbi:uncharacterized protein LOC103964876 [Pyrus x bretschneideri]|uniref:uncharacterized protein LOC103964876 n=1 Tax=Pyrus x bretschneideri TaxID=225117 RepID=UPI00202F2675|nr:uncharacterized protein LOC103964876 [Pyrus x bretschneideri]